MISFRDISINVTIATASELEEDRMLQEKNIPQIPHDLVDPSCGKIWHKVSEPPGYKDCAGRLIEPTNSFSLHQVRECSSYW